jgi:hypothetical protein
VKEGIRSHEPPHLSISVNELKKEGDSTVASIAVVASFVVDAKIAFQLQDRGDGG